MASLSIVAKLLRASQEAYDVTATGAVAIRPPFDQIGWLAPPQGFASGQQNIDAALVGETETEIIVAFRGTLPPNSGSPDYKQVLEDWLNDLDALLVPGVGLPGLVHKGFLGSLDALWPDVLGAIAGGKPLYFTGHSKGAAVANLAAVRYQTQKLPAVAPVVTTFAGPKAGDRDFQIEYDRIIPHSVRYENRDDLVPHLPPSVNFQRNLGAIPLFQNSALKAAANTPLGGEGYVSVGELQFIDWSGAIVPNSTTLPLQRYISLAEKVFAFQFETIIDDHRIGDGGGYAKAILPADVRTQIAQAVPGVSRLV